MGSYLVNIPPLVLKEAGFGEDEKFEIEAKDGKIVLKKKKTN